MTDRWDDAIRLALAPCRDLEATDEQVRRALEAAAPPPRRPRRRAALGVLLALVVVGGAAAVPATRAGVDSVYDSIAAWVGGDDAPAPGRPLTPADEVPGWLRHWGGERRVLAEAGGAKMIAVRERDGRLTIALGSSFAETGTIDDYRERLGDRATVLVGPADAAPGHPLDAHWRRPLFGLATNVVTRVKLRYAFGPSTIDRHVDGAFGLLVDTTRRLRELVAYDRTGHVVDRRDLRRLDLRLCREVRGCPPGKLIPPLAPRPRTPSHRH